MEPLKSIVIYISVLALAISVTLGLSSLFSNFSSDYEVVVPEEGVHCIVVSRMYNTSVDCWEVKQDPKK